MGDTGPSDLAKAVRDDGTPGAEEALRSEGFVRGYQRLWSGPRGSEVIVFVYQFETPMGAFADFERAKPRLTAEALPGASPFTVDGLPPNESIAVAGSSGARYGAVVLFAKGVFNVQIACTGPDPTGLEACVSEIANDQYVRL